MSQFIYLLIFFSADVLSFMFAFGNPMIEYHGFKKLTLKAKISSLRSNII